MPKSQANPKPPAPAAAPRFAVALAGGGFLGAVYELGALAAIEEAVVGMDWRNAHALVGVSAGAFVAAGLANGIAPREMVRLFVAGDQKDGFDPASMLRPNLSEFSHRLTILPGLIASAAVHYLNHRSGFMASLKRVGKALPTGIFEPSPGERFLARLFARAGRTNDFRELNTTLRVIAIGGIRQPRV
jgi:NTE family protein